MPGPTAVGPADRAASPSAIAGLAELLAGALFLRYALPDPIGAGIVAQPGVSRWGLLVPPFACLGLGALIRVWRHGLRFPLGWAAAEALLGATLVVGGASVVGIATPALGTERVALLAVVVGLLCVGAAIVVTGVAYVTDPGEPTRVGILLVGWPGLSFGWWWLVVLLDAGSVLTPALGPVGLALALDGLQAVVRSRWSAPGGVPSRASSRRHVPP